MEEKTNKSQKKIKILLIGTIPPPMGGASYMVQILLNSKFSQTFEIIFINTKYIKTIFDLRKFTILKLLKTIKYLFIVFYVLSFKNVAFVIVCPSTGGYSIIKDAIFSLISSRIFKKKLILWMHGNGYLDYDERHSVIKKLIDNMSKDALIIITLGDNLKNAYLRWCEAEKMVTVPNGINMMFDDSILEYRRNRALHKNVKNTTVLYLSNLDESKGFKIVLYAARNILNLRKDINFVFCGAWANQDQMKMVSQFCKDYNLYPFIEFRGKTLGRKKMKAYEDADIFVFPTSFSIETFGLVNIEAMDAGLPIITTSRGAIPEIVQDGINGFLVPEQNVKAVAEKIILLVDNPSLRFEMGKINRIKFKENYTIDIFADRWISLIEKLSNLRQ